MRVATNDTGCIVKLFFLLTLLFYVGDLNAQDHGSAIAESPLDVVTPLHTLGPVVVHATSIESGETTIGGAELDMLPSATGSITEALKGMSQIQYDYERQSSLTVGEIAPPRISISGAKPYENNFMIDGMSVTNTLNPSGLNNAKSAPELTVGGGDVAIFYDTSLIDSIQVYSNNIPAAYGGFVGGVVDAKLREPRSDRWRFSVNGRYTEDSWFDLRDADKESRTPTNQPRFKIYRASLSAEGPVSDYASMLLSYARQQSSIPLTRVTADGTTYKDSQQRTNENYFARLNLQPHNELKVNIDLTYAPYEALRWDPTYRDSEWTIENQSWRFATQADYFLSSGVLTTKAAVAQHGFSRDSKTSFRYFGPDDQYGGLGDAENRNREAQVAVSFLSTNYDMEAGDYNYAAGLEYGYKHIDMWSEGVEIHNFLDATEVRAARRTIQTYEEITQSGHNSNIGGYGQFEVTWQRFLVRPGIRIDYDRFSGNTDIATRFKSEYDVFGNSTVRLGVGVNRYYGRHLSAYAFRRHRPINTQIYDIQSDGSEVPRDPTLSARRSFSSDGLSTPYSDELSAEISGSVLGLEYGVAAIRRKHKKQLISKTNDGLLYVLTNDGESEYQGISGSLARFFTTSRFGKHRLSLSATKSKTISVTGYYDSDDRVSNTLTNRELLVSYDLAYETVFYEGKIIPRSDLPAEYHNAPLIVALTVNSSFYNDRLRLMSVVRWRDSIKGLVFDRRISDDTPYGTTSGSNTSTSRFWINPEGGYSQAYTSGKISGGAITDMSLELDLYHAVERTFTLVGDVLNAFNGRVETGQVLDDTNLVNHGRGFYLGFKMVF